MLLLLGIASTSGPCVAAVVVHRVVWSRWVGQEFVYRENFRSGEEVRGDRTEPKSFLPDQLRKPKPTTVRTRKDRLLKEKRLACKCRNEFNLIEIYSRYVFFRFTVDWW